MLIYRLCLYTGYIQVIYRLYTGYIQVIYRLYTGYIQVIYRLYTGYIQVIYRQVIYRLYRYAYSLCLFAMLIHRFRCHTRHRRFVHMI
jgi:hypothetical protein